VKIIATFITRDGFRRRETIPELRPHYDIPRPAKMGLAHEVPDANKAPTGLTIDKVTFYLKKHEVGLKGAVIYAEYWEA
jgi:hypothetical protein